MTAVVALLDSKPEGVEEAKRIHTKHTSQAAFRFGKKRG